MSADGSDVAARERTTPPPLASETERRADLAAMKRNATGLLVVVALTWLALLLTTDDSGAWGYAIAAAEAGMVGGLADWFAVTAVFRHPLGIPIPHTAVVASRKDQFGLTLGQFMSENFLTADVLADRLRAAQPATRLGEWLVDRDNAQRLAGQIAELLSRLIEQAKDDEAVGLLETELRRRVEDLDMAPAMGRLLRLITVDGHHQKLLDELLPVIDAALVNAEPTLHRRFTAEAPWWMPEPVDEAIFTRLFTGVRAILADAADDSDTSHGLRGDIQSAVEGFITRLEYDPVMAERVQDLKAELLDSPRTREWLGAVWTELKQRVLTDAATPTSVLRARITAAVVSTGRRLLQDEGTRQRTDQMIQNGVQAGVAQFGDQVVGLVANTVSSWDSAQTSDRLELLLGRDLQFIRINGTVVGALAGVVIHAISQVAG